MAKKKVTKKKITKKQSKKKAAKKVAKKTTKKTWRKETAKKIQPKKTTKKVTKKKPTKAKAERYTTRDYNGQSFNECLQLGKEGKLTARMEMFCHEYLKNNFNGFRAAVNAGYAPSSAHTKQFHLLKKDKIIERIREIAGEAISPAQENINNIIKEIEKLVSVDTKDLFIEETIYDEHGEDTGAKVYRLKTFEQLEKEGHGGKAIKSITPTKYGYKFEFYDKYTGLKLLSELHGLLKQSIELSGVGGEPVKVRTLSDFYNEQPQEEQ